MTKLEKFKKFIADYDVVVWDWNGTLLNDSIHTHKVICSILENEGLNPISMEAYRDHFGFPIANYYKKIGLPSIGSEFDRVAHDFIDGYKTHYNDLILFDDSEELLRTVNELCIQQYILSAAKSDELKLLLDKFELSDYFNDVSGASDIYAHGKIDQAIAMKTYFESQGYRKGLYIGDTDHDFEVSQALGYDFCFSEEGHQSLSRLGGTKVSYVLSDRKQ